VSKWDEWGSDHEVSLDMPRLDRCYVYVAWGQDEVRPLYVGKARNPWARIATHMRHKSWIADVVRWEAHGFPTEKLALEAEDEAIHALNPIHNGIRRLPRSIMDQRWLELFERNEREAAEQKRLARERLREQLRERRPPPIRVPRKRVRRAPLDDVFTPEQLAIIARVQNRGIR